MPSSARAKMFIASCEDNPPAKIPSPPAQCDGTEASPSKEPANRSRNFGFSVCDILMEQRTAKLKKVPLIVISGGNSRTVTLRQTDFSPIPNCDEPEVERSECSPSEHSLSPPSSKPEIARVETSNRQQREKPRLKFSIDRILADESRVPIIDNNSHDNTGEVCRPSCTCADEISPLPTLVNSRFSYRNSSSFDYPAHHSQVSLSDYNRHQLTSAFYSSNLLSSAYTSTPWSIHNHYAHHHHLLHPVATSVYPVAHLGSTNSIIESSRNYHHYPNHHHGGLYVGNGDVSGTNSVGANSSSAVGVTSNSGKRKRSWSRAVFSNLQRKGLEKRFQIQKYITKPDRRQLAATLGLTDAQVKVWFQNRRMKWRHSKEAKEEMAKQNSGSANKVAETDSRKVERPTNINTTAEQHANTEKQSDTCLKIPEQT